MAEINTEAIPSNFVSALPHLFALKCVSNNKYMRCESGGDVERLTFSAEAILYEPRTRFAVEQTNTEGVVHIRCTFNNKYLRRDSRSSQWIGALATNISEDIQRWDCTMFQVLPAQQGGGQIQLRHIQLGCYLGSYIGGGLRAGTIIPSGSEKQFNFTFINYSTLVILPRYVAFKGSNGKYLKRGVSDSLEFISNDKGEAGVTMEVVPASDGNVYIKEGPGQSSRYWTRCESTHLQFKNKYVSWINSPFQPVKDEVNRISFRHLASNIFCCMSDGLYVANASSITQDTKLIAEEAIMRRTLEIEWRLQDARIYDVEPNELNGSTHDNNSSSPVTKSVTLTYRTAVTTNFQTSHTGKGGIKTIIETPKIPFIGGGLKIDLSAEYGGSYTWGESTTNFRSYSETDNYTIPPWTRLVVQKLSTKGHCDVPYKYVQTDYLLNGDVIRTDKEDGIYEGINYFNIHTSNRDEPLPGTGWRGSVWGAAPEIFVDRPVNSLLKLKEPLIFLFLAWLCVVMMERFSKNSSS